jgi:hypothetical protein
MVPHEAARRRGFTVNAMAFDPLTGELIDLYGGDADLRDRILRHTSDQFAEDPLRVLRDTGWVDYFPDLAALSGCEQDPGWHPEGGVWTHTRHCLDALAAERIGDPWEDLVVGLAVLCHDCGKPATTTVTARRIRSLGHCETGVEPTRRFLAGMSNHQELVNQVVPLIAEHL